MSDAFHLPRAWVIFSLLGTADLSLYATESDFEAPLSTRLKWSLREGAAIWFNVGRVAVLPASRDLRGWIARRGSRGSN